MVGLAFGIYGLTQALFQIPFGAASDRFGRKPVITAGLLLMLAGSLVAASADTLTGLAMAAVPCRAPARYRRRSARCSPTPPATRSGPRRWRWSAP